MLKLTIKWLYFCTISQPTQLKCLLCHTVCWWAVVSTLVLSTRQCDCRTNTAALVYHYRCICLKQQRNGQHCNIRSGCYIKSLNQLIVFCIIILLQNNSSSLTCFGVWHYLLVSNVPLCMSHLPKTLKAYQTNQ